MNSTPYISINFLLLSLLKIKLFLDFFTLEGRGGERAIIVLRKYLKAVKIT